MNNLSVSKEGFTTQVYQQLRWALSTGAYKPGQMLNMREIAKQLNVSQTPVREALGRLVSDGALVQSGYRPARVPMLSPDEYMEVCKVRATLEGLAAQEAARRATTEQIDALEAIHLRIRVARDADDLPGILAANRDFHIAASALAGMPTLQRLVDNLWLIAGPVVSWLGRRPLPRPPQRHPHTVLIANLRKGDGQAASKAIEEDIMLNAEALIPFLAAQQLPAPDKSPFPARLQ